MKRRPTILFQLRTPAAAFTLVEMLVALVVLVVAMGIVTTVFSVTTRTVSQSAALAEVQQNLRAFMLQLEADLAGVDPAASILVLHGRTQPGALNQEDLEARKYLRFLEGDPAAAGGNPEFDPPASLDPQYSEPRADIMMFFSNRELASQAPPLSDPGAGSPYQPYYHGAKSAPVQIVYGHAAVDGFAQTSAGPPPTYDYADQLRHVAQLRTDGTGRSILPIERWHLARRAVLIVPTSGALAFAGGATGNPTSDAFPRILRCDNRFQPYPGDVVGDTQGLDLDLLFTAIDLSGPGIPVAQVSMQPYNPPPPVLNLVRDVLYPTGATRSFHHVATVVENPPADLQSNLGVHGLQACAWFKVEFLMPEDPRNARDYYDTNATLASRNTRIDMPRWTEVEPGETYVFLRDTAENRNLVASQYNGASVGPRLAEFGLIDPFGALGPGGAVERRRVRMWPYAIRVTVRVYDRLGRLPQPVERSLVHWFD